MNRVEKKVEEEYERSISSMLSPGEEVLIRASGTTPNLPGVLALTSKRLLIFSGAVIGKVSVSETRLTSVDRAVYDSARIGHTFHSLLVDSGEGNFQFRFGPGKGANAEGSGWPAMIMEAKAHLIRRDSQPIGPSPGSGGIAEQLEKLGALHASGALSDGEYATAKARILG